MKVALVDTVVTSFRLPVYDMLADKGIEIICTGDFGYLINYNYHREESNYTFLKPKKLPYFAHGWCPSLWGYLKRNNFDIVISCDVSQTQTWISYLYCKTYNKKFVLWNEAWQWSKMLRAKLIKPVIRRIIKGADALIATGEKSKKFLINFGGKEKRIFISYNYAEDLQPRIDMDEVMHIREKYALEGHPSFLYVCRIIPNKAVDVLVKAFNKMPNDCRLLIVGDYDPHTYWKGSKNYCRYCKSLTRHTGIIWVGRVPYEEIQNYYKACDVFLLTPRFMPNTINPNESWGMVVNEAMSVGKPLIVSNAVGASDAVDETNGLKVIAENEQSLLEAMQKILTMDLDKMGKASRKKVEEIFTKENMAKGFLDAIEYVK